MADSAFLEAKLRHVQDELDRYRYRDTYAGCEMPFPCGIEVPHNCQAEYSLVALLSMTEVYATRILPHLRVSDFATPLLRGAIPRLKRRYYETIPGLRHLDLFHRAEADPEKIDLYLQQVRTCALQRRQISALASLIDKAWREPLHNFSADVALAQAEERQEKHAAATAQWVDDSDAYGDIPEVA